MKKTLGSLFGNRSTVSSFFLDNARDAMWEERNYYNFAKNSYIKNVIAFRSIHMIASAAGAVNLILKKITKEGTFQIHDHHLLKLLSRPNHCMTRAEFIESIITYRLISGNAYILVVSSSTEKPIELHLLRPDRVEISLSHENCPTLRYKYSVGNLAHEFKMAQHSKYNEILHLKNFHPLNDWYGLATTEAAAYSIEQHNQAGAWNKAMLQNSARPCGALVINSKDGKNLSLSHDQYQRLKTQIDDFYVGSRNSGRPLLLEGGLDWKEMSLSPKDMDFIEAKNMAAREIALAFGVPPQLLGIPGDNTYSNFSEARLALWEQTILPNLESILAHLNAWLVPRYGKNLFLSYDKESISVLTEKRQRLWQYVQNASFMSTNEKRAAFGLPPIDGGNVLKI